MICCSGGLDWSFWCEWEEWEGEKYVVMGGMDFCVLIVWILCCF